MGGVGVGFWGDCFEIMGGIVFFEDVIVWNIGWVEVFFFFIIKKIRLYLFIWVIL